MSKVIVFRNDAGDGNQISVCVPSSDELLEHAINNDIPKDRGYIVVDRDSLPHAYADFFDAWEVNFVTGEITVNLYKVKEIHKHALRNAREPLMQKLDVAFQRALEEDDNEKRALVVALKKQLRDITSSPAFEIANTVEEVRQISLPEINI